MASVREILSSYANKVSKSMSINDKVLLTNVIKEHIKLNIGHGVSQEYYDKLWGNDKIEPKYIVSMIHNAKYHKGCWSNKNVFKGRPKKIKEEE